MQISYNHELGGERRMHAVSGNRVRIGSRADNDLVLAHPSVPPVALVLHVKNRAWEVVGVGPNVRIGDRPFRPNDREVLDPAQAIRIWPFTLEIELPEAAPGDDAVRATRDRELSALTGRVHLDLLARMDLAAVGVSQREENDQYHLAFEGHVEEIARKTLPLTATDPLADHAAGLCVRQQCVEAVLGKAGEQTVWKTSGRARRLLSAVPEREAELAGLVRQALDTMLPAGSSEDVSDQVRLVERDFWPAWDALAADLFPDVRNYFALRHLKKDLKDIVFGYGPLEDLLRLPSVTEIMVVDRERIYIEKGGVVENSGRRFVSDDVTEAVIQRIVSKVGRRVDRSSPLVDARLADGSRVNAVIAPLAVSGPCLTIRKFSGRKLTVAELVRTGSLTPAAARFLEAAVVGRKNILVSGGTGTGKTTLLNCLSDFIPTRERIVTVEDTAELQLHKPHVVRLESKAANVEGAGAYTIRDLVKNSLRMRPDRIVVGECRGAEALDMLQAMNTGHDGSMTTLHANTARDVILRLEVLVRMAADLPIDSVHRQIASAVDVVVQLSRSRSGRRRVTQITEFTGVDEDRGGVRTRDLFLRDDHGDDSELEPTGALPTFLPDLIAKGMIDLQAFYR